MVKCRYPHINKLSLSGLVATFVGNGIGRFAYIALFPIIIQQAWFNYSEASYLGAATLFGYLIGVPLNNYLSKKISNTALLRLSMLICSLSYFACSWQMGGFWWFIIWRTVAGICGAILMVLAPHIILNQCKVNHRARFTGVVFSGVGIGIMASGTIVPILLHLGLKETWIVLGMICLLLTWVTWNQWDSKLLMQDLTSNADSTVKERDVKKILFPIILLLIAYALNAVGYLPHTLFWVVYITNELHMSLAAGGFFWGVFGVGAVIGPFLTGELSNYFSLSKILFVSFLLKALGVALPLFSSSPISLFFSSLLVGIFTPGVVNIVSSYSMKIVGSAYHKQAWGWMTFSFAFAQAIVGYIMVFIMKDHASYWILFMVSAIALLISSVCIIILVQVEKVELPFYVKKWAVDFPSN